jgi:MFS family permease
VVAQATMIAASLVAMRLAAARGYWLVLLISFAALPVRGLIAACLIKSWGVVPVQILDGVGAGLQSVAVPGLVARILNGTGRINVGQGALMTVQGVGAALSPAIGGWLAERAGYPSAFLALGALAAGSLFIWVWFAPLLRPACSDASAPGAAAHSA